MWFANYPPAEDALNPLITVTFTVTVSAATCECGLIEWNSPTTMNIFTTIGVDPVVTELVEVGPNYNSMTETAGARACGESAYDCNYSYTIEIGIGPAPDDNDVALTALPYWITYDSPNLTVAPQLVSEMGE